MRVYNTPHSYYCGVDLHARSLIVNILDDKGRTRLEQDLPASSPMLSQLTSSLKGSFCQPRPPRPGNAWVLESRPVRPLLSIQAMKRPYRPQI
jgi:hypothetical protein